MVVVYYTFVGCDGRSLTTRFKHASPSRVPTHKVRQPERRPERQRAAGEGTNGKEKRQAAQTGRGTATAGNSPVPVAILLKQGLHHEVTARNLNAILKAGLLCSKSKGKMPAVWLCSPTKTSWAVLH